MTDTDWEILERRLTEIERSLGILQAYIDTSLKEKYHGNSGAIGVAYALNEGSLVDAGLNQQWQHTHKGEDNV